MKKFITLGFLSLSLLVVGCSEGPAEKNGRKVDNAVEKVKDSVQNKGPAQKAGERVDSMAE